MALVFKGRHRRDVDDAQRLAIGDAAGGEAGGEQPRRVDVHRHHLVVEFGAELVGAGRIGNTGVVDQDRHRTHRGFHRFGQRQALRLIGDIDLKGPGRATRRSDFGHQRIKLVGAARAQRHAGAGGREDPGKAGAKP